MTFSNFERKKTLCYEQIRNGRITSRFLFIYQLFDNAIEMFVYYLHVLRKFV